MKTEKKKVLYVRLGVAVTIALTLVFLFSDMPMQAGVIWFMLGGILGLVTNTMPFVKPQTNPNPNFTISYGDDSIGGPALSLLFIIIGFMLLFSR